MKVQIGESPYWWKIFVGDKTRGVPPIYDRNQPVVKTAGCMVYWIGGFRSFER